MALRTHIKMPSTRCQSLTIISAKDEFNELSRPSARSGVRTEILLNDDGILEVYHLGRKAGDRGCGDKEGMGKCLGASGASC
jgi:hypothetical protein